MVTAGLTRRAVVLVGGPAKPYSRALRIARTLVAEGYEVEIAAITATGAPAVEPDGPITIRRYAPSGRFAPYATRHSVALADDAPPVPPPAATVPSPGSKAPARKPLPLRVLGRVRGRGRRLLRDARGLRAQGLWPLTVRGWWATLARDLEPADLYHACGTLTIAPALAAAARSRRLGRRPIVVYDAVDNTFEGNNVTGMPPILRRIHARRERRWARAADARTTVNDALAARLATRWRVGPLVVIPNWPEPAQLEEGPQNRIRDALGLPADARIVLFQGRLSPNLGLEEAAEAVLLVEGARLVLLGFGRWLDRSRARDRDPRFAGRHFTLPAVHPDELPAWTASADVALVTLPVISRNQRDSTPNKFWESLHVGTPVVLGPGLDVMAGIVRELDAGVVAESLAPDALARAIRLVLDEDPAVQAARRRRVATAARERYSWPVAADRYRRLIHDLEERRR